MSKEDDYKAINYGTRCTSVPVPREKTPKYEPESKSSGPGFILGVPLEPQTGVGPGSTQHHLSLDGLRECGSKRSQGSRAPQNARPRRGKGRGCAQSHRQRHEVSG